jgi:hypothetical protein
MNRRTATHEGVENDVASGRAVQGRVGNHCNRLRSTMESCQAAFFHAPAKTMRSGIAPDVTAVTARLAMQVSMRLSTVLEYEDQFMPPVSSWRGADNGPMAAVSAPLAPASAHI